MADFYAINPFGAPIRHFERVSSTMDEARKLAAEGCPHGTVAAADFQESGRGRVRGRLWDAEEGAALLCTTILRFGSISRMPAALTLRAGLAAAEAIEATGGFSHGRIQVKWPNDVLALIPGTLPSLGRKLCGILCESDGEAVYVGTGFNIAQSRFPSDIAGKATSMLIETGDAPRREAVLAAFLERLRSIIADERWKERLEARLFRKDERVVFETGAADSGKLVEGTLAGIGAGGELLIRPDGESNPRAFVNGELKVYG